MRGIELPSCLLGGYELRCFVPSHIPKVSRREVQCLLARGSRITAPSGVPRADCLFICITTSADRSSCQHAPRVLTPSIERCEP